MSLEQVVTDIAEIRRRCEENKTVSVDPVEDSAEIVARNNRAVAMRRAREASFVWEKFSAASVDGFRTQPGTRAGKEAAQGVIAADFKRSLALYGPSTGVGKTWLGSGILNEAIAKGIPAGGIDALHLVTQIRDARKDWDLSETDAVARIADIPVLLIDDLGKDLMFGGNEAIRALYQVVDRRDKRGLPLLITSNLSFQDLIDRYSARTDDASYLIDRIRGMVPFPGCWVEMTGRSLRGRV